MSLIIFSANTKPSLETKVWDTRTTIGSLDAKYHYIMYTDLMCPYCDVFSRVVKDNLDEFKRDYIDGKSILFE
ncbi:thioredoxin domain-containing protein, partial [Candidatus Saccharibacteria bacterium]|nr:thioredoxin domain-containing protein [Candidatus Saccharibacteria bacterium]